MSKRYLLPMRALLSSKNRQYERLIYSYVNPTWKSAKSPFLLDVLLRYRSLSPLVFRLKQKEYSWRLLKLYNILPAEYVERHPLPSLHEAKCEKTTDRNIPHFSSFRIYTEIQLENGIGKNPASLSA